jgi:hypothetical protein
MVKNRLPIPFHLPFTCRYPSTYCSKLGWRYPRSSSCKLKDAESLKYHYGAEGAGEQGTCRQWNEQLLARVLASVPEEKRESLVFDEDTIIFDDDVTDFAGPIWVESLGTDYGPNTIYLDGEDGKLHIRSAASVVARNNPLPFLGPDKKGTFYCHLPTAEHILAIIFGDVAPCSDEDVLLCLPLCAEEPCVTVV